MKRCAPATWRVANNAVAVNAMAEGLIALLHFLTPLRQLATERWARRRLVERGLKRFGFSRKRAKAAASRIP